MKDCHCVTPESVGSLIDQGRAAWLCFRCTVPQKCSSPCLHFTPVLSVVSLLSSWNCSQCLLTASARCVLTGVLISCLIICGASLASSSALRALRRLSQQPGCAQFLYDSNPNE